MRHKHLGQKNNFNWGVEEASNEVTFRSRPEESKGATNITGDTRLEEQLTQIPEGKSQA
jgi:hypothetical protein